MTPTIFATRAEAFEASEDTPTNLSTTETFGDIVQARYVSRRSVLRGMTAVAAITAITVPLETMVSRVAQTRRAPLSILTKSLGVDEPITSRRVTAPMFSCAGAIRCSRTHRSSIRGGADAQAMQFGYNNDYIGYAPLPIGSENSDRALLCVNHEYTNEEVMFSGIARQDKIDFPDMTAELVDIEMAAHGGTVVVIPVEKVDGTWRPSADRSRNRRITANTRMRLSAAGSDRLKTSGDPTGTRVLGTVNNCAGGMTPGHLS